ncbi:MAG: M20/M25/M40 family metallo-hydrolase [bacterium]
MINKTGERMRTFFLLCTLLFVAAPVAAQAQLSAVERAMVEHVDRHNNAALALLEQVVNINSGSMNFAGVRQVGDIFRAKLDALGFETRWVEGKAFQRAGHLVAKRIGKGPRLLLIGHLDTVFEPDSPFQRFEVLNDTTARGPGIGDMKGGDVIIVHALAALQAVGVLDDMNIIVVMTGDEERSGRPLALARQDLIEAAKAADIAIGFENGDGDPTTAIVARRSSTGWQLRVTGKPAHSSQIFRKDVGAGAIYEAARILYGFYERLAGEQYLTFNPGVILGGTDVDYDASQDRGAAFGKSNVVAEHAVAAGDLRTISPEQLERAKTTMQAVVAERLPQTTTELTFRDSYPPLAPTDGNRKLLGLFDKVSRDLGFGAVAEVDPMRAGAADVSFTAAHVEMAIDGLGLGGADDHTVRETGDLRTLPIQTKRAAVLLYRLSRGHKE